MKALKFMLPVAALGLLASCSSEIDAPNPGPGADGEAGAFIGISLATPELTRADNNAKDGESNINNVTLKLSVGTTVLFEGQASVINAPVAGEEAADSYYDKAALKAYFKISEAQYNQLNQYKDEQVRVLVVANAGTDKLPATESNVTTSNTTWTNNNFIFSGAGIGKLATDTQNDHKSPATAWFINDGATGNAATIQLVRLASRFDAVETTNDTNYENGVYTALSDENLKITIDGFDEETHVDEAYWYANTKWFTANTSAIFPYTGSFSTTEKTSDMVAAQMKLWKTYKYEMAVDGNSQYDHPVYCAAANLAYAKAPIALVKATLTHTMLAEDYNGDIYVWNGCLLGSLDNINDKTITYEGIEDQKGNKISEFVNALREAAFNGEVTDKDLAKFPAIQTFKAENGKFTAYYVSYITTGNDYKVDRNTVYKLSANSFWGVGDNGDHAPGTTPTGNMMNFWFDLQVSVADWAVETNGLDF